MILLPFRRRRCLRWRLRSPKTLFLLLCIVYLNSPFSPWYKRRRGFDIHREAPYIAALDPSTRRSSRPVDPKKWCARFPTSIFNQTQVVIKIGAPDAHTKLAGQLRTNAACVKDLLVFSDYEEEVLGRRVYDVLSELPAEEWGRHDSYQTYVEVKRARAAGEAVRTTTAEGWKLDKYKFLPMLDRTFEMRPNKTWYVFVEADTYVFWEGLFRLLGHLDSRKALYIGSPIWRLQPREPHFAHGGSGIIVSRPGLKKLVRQTGHMGKGRVAGSSQYGNVLDDKCCGDAVLADAFHDVGIHMTGFWPMINGEKPATLRFGKEDQWCEPVITLHHVNTTDMQELYDWESRRDPGDPLRLPVLYKDIWHWQKAAFPEYKEDWMIFPEQDWEEGIDTPEDCKQQCLIYHRTWCYQWQLHDGRCGLSPWIRVGQYQPPDADGKRWYSGTLMDRVEAHERRMGHCPEAHWVRADPDGTGWIAATPR